MPHIDLHAAPKAGRRKASRRRRFLPTLPTPRVELPMRPPARVAAGGHGALRWLFAALSL